MDKVIRYNPPGSLKGYFTAMVRDVVADMPHLRALRMKLEDVASKAVHEAIVSENLKPMKPKRKRKAKMTPEEEMQAAFDAAIVEQQKKSEKGRPDRLRRAIANRPNMKFHNFSTPTPSTE